MPVVQQLAARRIHLTFREDSEEYEITYKPFGQDLLDELVGLGDEEADPKLQARGVFTGLKRVLVDWNMYADSEQTIKTPISDEGLLTVPLDVLNLIWAKVNEDMSVGKKRGKGSLAPLRRVD